MGALHFTKILKLCISKTMKTQAQIGENTYNRHIWHLEKRVDRSLQPKKGGPEALEDARHHEPSDNHRLKPQRDSIHLLEHPSNQKTSKNLTVQVQWEMQGNRNPPTFEGKRQATLENSLEVFYKTEHTLIV